MGTTISYSKPATPRARKDRGNAKNRNNAGAPPDAKAIILFCFDKNAEEFSLKAAIDCLSQSGHVGIAQRKAAAHTVRAILDRMEKDGSLQSRVSLKPGQGKLWRRT